MARERSRFWWLNPWRELKRYAEQRDYELQRYKDIAVRNAADREHRHKKELAQRDEQVVRVLERCIGIDFRRYSQTGQYAVLVRFHPQIFNHGITRGDSLYLGRMVGDMVAQEIASSKFIHKAVEM